MSKETCFVSNKEFEKEVLIKGADLRPQLLALIKKDHPTFSPEEVISIESVALYRKKYLESLIKKEHREINKLEHEVIQAIQANELLSDSIDPSEEKNATLGNRIADNIASFGGSWTFIISFFSFLFVWMAINIFVFATNPFDPYPFILLNLILSCLAAIQAPVIMMSQNRKEQKDRLRSENDYKVNLKAELEIRVLSEKMDHLILNQNKRLLDIQELQLDYLADITKAINEKKG